MKAIAFAIICAGFINVSNAEISLWGEGFKACATFSFVISICGFWICILFERNSND